MSLETAGEPNFGNVVRQMNKVMDQIQKGFFSFCPAETWTPQVNLYEKETAYLLCVDLAGVDKEKIDLIVEAGQLRLRGHRLVPLRPDPGEAEGESEGESRARLRVHLMEIDHGPFCREVALPDDVDHGEIAASYENGMLWIELPKK